MRKPLSIILFILVLLAVFLYRPSISLGKLAMKYSTDASKTVDVNGINAHYKQKGKGYPLLLLHGTSASCQTWDLWMDDLAKHFTVYSIDQPGSGLTGPHPDHDYSSEAYIDFLESFCNKLGIDSFYIAGNSRGGKTAWKYASQSGRIKKLIVVNPAGFYGEGHKTPMVFKLGKSKSLSKIVEGLNVKPFINKSLKEVYYNDELITKDLKNRYNDLIRLKGNRLAFFEMALQNEEGSVEELKQIKCPTLIQWGANDPWLSADLAKMYDEYIPDSKVTIYEECGHVPQEEISAKSVKDAIEFLLN